MDTTLPHAYIYSRVDAPKKVYGSSTYQESLETKLTRTPFVPLRAIAIIYLVNKLSLENGTAAVRCISQCDLRCIFPLCTRIVHYEEQRTFPLRTGLQCALLL